MRSASATLTSPRRCSTENKSSITDSVCDPGAGCLMRRCTLVRSRLWAARFTVGRSGTPNTAGHAYARRRRTAPDSSRRLRPSPNPGPTAETSMHGAGSSPQSCGAICRRTRRASLQRQNWRICCTPEARRLGLSSRGTARTSTICSRKHRTLWCAKSSGAVRSCSTRCSARGCACIATKSARAPALCPLGWEDIISV
jgi:hypothetical protein